MQTNRQEILLRITMRYKYFERDGICFTFKINSVEDTLDLNRFKRRSFKDFKEVLKMNRERAAKKLAKDMVVSLLKRISHDLIYNNEIFIFPIPAFGYVKISNTANFNREDYVYDIESDGKIWTPKFKVNPDIWKKNKKHYKIRFNQTLRQKMFDLIQTGHKYR